MTTTDIAVIGAGIAGASVAHFAAAAGLRVTLIDGGLPAGGVTGFAAANIRCHHTDPRVARFAIEGREIFRHWGDVIGRVCGFIETGGLYIVPPADAAKLFRNVEMLRGLGLNNVAVDAAGLRDLQPFMTTDDVGAAAYEPESGYADPSLAVASLLERARERGARCLFVQREVRILREGDRVTGVATATERIEAPNVVLAAGIGSRALAAALGLDLPLHPFPLGAGLLRRPPALAPPMTVIDRAIGGWYRADRDDLLIEAGYEDLDFTNPTSLDHHTTAPPPTPGELINAATRLCRRIPQVAEAIPGRTWAGLDSCTPDGHPIAGPVPSLPGFHLLTGANGVGIRLAPPLARALVDTIVNDNFAASSLAPFALARYETGALFGDANSYGVGSFS